MMPSIDITKAAVDAIVPNAKSTVYYDSELTGFGVRVTPKGHKSWIVEYRPDGGGRGVSSRRMTLGSVSTLPLDRARQSARVILAKALLGSDPASVREENRKLPNVREFSERFLKDYVEEKLKASTTRTYRSCFRRLINPRIGAHKINLLTKAEIRSVHRDIARTGRGDKRREGAANRTLTTLSSMYTFAIKEEVLIGVKNPVHGIEPYKENYTPHYLTTVEVEKIGAALVEAETVGIPREAVATARAAKQCPEGSRVFLDPHAIAGIRLLLLTGMRKGELLNLRWEHVDFERGLLFLPDSKTGQKTVVLNSYALTVLADIPVVGPYVVAGGDPSKPRPDLRFQWEILVRRAGIAHARIHDLRHTHASIGVAGGLGLPIIGKILGHKTAKTTERYAHLETDPVLRASEKIGSFLSAALSGNRTSPALPGRHESTRFDS